MLKRVLASVVLTAALVAAPAAAVEVAVGLYGGAAYPQGDTTAYIPLTTYADKLADGGLGKGGVFGGKAVLYLTPAVGVEVAATPTCRRRR